jgi:hypothetical protein
MAMLSLNGRLLLFPKRLAFLGTLERSPDPLLKEVEKSKIVEEMKH